MVDLRPEELLDDNGFYNPLDEKNLARGVAEALTSQPVHPLRRLPSFEGSGIYALYYVGNFPLYQPFVQFCKRGGCEEQLDLGPHAVPIYVGKSSVSSSRRGKLRDGGNKVLYKRIGTHRGSVKAVSGLDLDDFRVRYMPVRDVWVPLGEAGLLQRFTPLWNVVLEGFGNNSPGGGRKDQKRSTWDTLHPGRPAAMKLPGNEESLLSIEGRVARAIAAIVESTALPEDTLAVDSEAEE
ncbi:Eco29kI family restriction endonuclease [Micromonospora sp. NPDC047644]|uniref:Eco29kI family restriction endonuclease n=1 Tax=Micromonospora sp. NPDC047644 TaxID=3157203 RepID=UPI003456CE17